MRALLVVMLLPLASAGVALADGTTATLSFPSTIVTRAEKIEWLSAQADAAAQTVEVETDKPLRQQRHAVYCATLARAADLMRLIKTIDGRLPRLAARVNRAIADAQAGLERIANRTLKIGMDARQVRQLRGFPKSVAETATASGARRQQWDYGMTVLEFEHGQLAEIRQFLNGGLIMIGLEERDKP